MVPVYSPALDSRCLHFFRLYFALNYFESKSLPETEMSSNETILLFLLHTFRRLSSISFSQINTYPSGASFHVPSLLFNLYLHRFDFFPSQGNASEESAYNVPGAVLDPGNTHP
jgi:hypothetical protein